MGAGMDEGCGGELGGGGGSGKETSKESFLSSVLMLNCPRKYIKKSVVFFQKHLCKTYYFTTIDEFRKSRKLWEGEV